MNKQDVAKVLREHWLTGLECDHEAKTDVANCFCGHWRPAPEPSVGDAVERWIEHVLAQLPPEPTEERTPIDSPSEICPLIGCKRRDDHQHIVVEQPNRT